MKSKYEYDKIRNLKYLAILINIWRLKEFFLFYYILQQFTKKRRLKKYYFAVLILNNYLLKIKKKNLLFLWVKRNFEKSWKFLKYVRPCRPTYRHPH